MGRGLSSWLMVVGTLVVLVGVVVDLRLHQHDPGLAAREGVVAFDNPGHRLLGIGIGTIVTGAALFLAGSFIRSTGFFRRAAITLTSVLLVLLSLGGLGAVTSEAVGGHGHQEVAATPAQRSAAERLAADTRAGSSRFLDFAVAEAEGFVRITPYRFGEIGWAHFINPKYIADGSLVDPERPESLLYFRTPRGEQLLVGAMYLAPVGQGPSIGGPITHWHNHENMCVGPAGVRRANTDGGCPTGMVRSRHEMLHVWFVDNPNGPFADEVTPALQAALLNHAGVEQRAARSAGLRAGASALLRVIGR